MSAVLPKVDTSSICEISKKKKKLESFSLSIGVRTTMIRCVVYLLRIFKMFHGLMNNPVLNLLTYLLTPWCRVLLEKLYGLQLVKKFPAFHGTRRFITALTSVRQLSLSWVTPIQSIYPHPTSWRSILM